MKLIMEGWRKYLKEEEEESHAARDAFVQASGAKLAAYVPLLKKIAADPEFQALAAAGQTDTGGPADEQFEVKEDTALATDLWATQAEIGFDNSLNDQMAVPSWGDPISAALGLAGSPIEMPCQDSRCAILTFGGKYILDGHHRWSQIMMMNPGGTVAIDDLQPNGVLKTEEGALKLMQLAIALKAGKVVTVPFEGSDLMGVGAEQVKEFVLKNIKEDALALLVKAGKPGATAEEAAEYISGNLAALQKRKGKFSRGAVMPQAGKSGTAQADVNAVLGTGAVNFNEPIPQDVKKEK